MTEKIGVSLYVRRGVLLARRSIPLSRGTASFSADVHAGIMGMFYFEDIDRGVDVEYEFSNGDLLYVDALSPMANNFVILKPRHLIEALSADEVTALAATGVCSRGNRSHCIAWRSLFRLLAPDRAVALALTDTRLVPLLSAKAAALYADRHPMLAEVRYAL